MNLSSNQIRIYHNICKNDCLIAILSSRLIGSKCASDYFKSVVEICLQGIFLEHYKHAHTHRGHTSLSDNKTNVDVLLAIMKGCQVLEER